MKKISNLKNYFKDDTFDLIIPSIFLSLIIVCIALKFGNYFPTSFNDRVMGNALLYGVDISKRINIFYFILFILFPLFFYLINIILSKKFHFMNKANKNELNLLSIMGIINLFFYLMDFMKDTSVCFSFSLWLLLQMVFIIIVFSSLSKKITKLKLENLNWAFIAIIPFMFIGTLFINRLGIKISDNVISLIIFGIGSIELFFVSNLKINFEALKKAYLFILMAPLFECIYLELYNILNQYNIIIPRKILFIFLIYFFSFFFFILSYIKLKNKKIEFNYKRIYYPIVIIIFALIFAQQNLVTTINTDFFETANHGESVFELFRFGKIPLLETFDAHMMSNQIWGILYGILNQDIQGACFCIYYSYEVLFSYLIIYFFLKKFFSNDLTLIILLFYPVMFDLGLIYYSFGLLSIFFLIKAINKNSFISFITFWLSIFFLCLWKLDIGFSSLLACLVVFFYSYIKKYKKISLKKFFSSFFSVLSLFLIIYIVFCIAKNINPILRILEFLKLTLSNKNWAFYSIGETSHYSYVICYYIMPIILVLSLFLNFLSFKKIKNQDSNQIILLLFLAMFIIFNYQRGIVRHSLAEISLFRIVSFGFIYFSLFCYYHIFKKYKTIKFLWCYLLFILLGQLLLTPQFLSYSNLLNESFIKYNSFLIHNEKANKKVQRVVLSDEMKFEYKDLKIVFDAILDEDETYLDLSNQTLLYALLDREKPVYINQSPGLLSGELSQQYFLKEVKDFYKEIPIILKAKGKYLSDNLDGIVNDYRYYLLSEETFKNYVPIANVNNYIIWSRKEKEFIYKEKISSIVNENIKIFSNKDEFLNLENKEVNLNYIPFIWGNYDKTEKEVISETTFNEVKNNYEISFSSNTIFKDNGNYIEVEIMGKSEENAALKMLSNSKELSTICFNLKKGTNKYLIRVSSFYTWYEGNLDKISLIFDKDTQLNYIKILKGDVLEN